MSVLEAGTRVISTDQAASLGRAGQPLVSVTTRFIDLNPIASARVRTADSIPHVNVMANFGPASIAGYDGTGRIVPIDVFRTNTGFTQRFGTNGTSADFGHAVSLGDGRVSGLTLTAEASRLRGLVTVVKSPYVDVDAGQRHLMTIDLDQQDAAPTLIDLPRPILESKMRMTGNVLTHMMDTNGNVVWGNSDSPFSLRGRNLQSVLWPHEHMFDVSLITPENAKAYRQHHERGDNGLTAHFGQTVGQQVEAAIPEVYRQGASVEADKEGFTLHIPNFSPENMKDPEFIDNFLLPLYGTIHGHISHTHDQLYQHPYKNVAERMQQFRRQGSMNDDEAAAYEQLFTLRDVPDETSLPEHLQEMRRLHRAGNLKEPIGVAIGILFSKDGSALLAVSPVFRQHEPFGPAELYGVRVNRKEEPADPDPDQLARQAANYTTLFHDLRERAIIN